MAARQPRVFIDHRAQQVGHLVIGPFPQRAEGAGRGDDRQVVNAEALGDFRQLVGHSRPAGDARHHALRAFQHAFQDFLGAAHFPQDVDVDGTLAAGNLVGALHLGHGPVDAIADQLAMAFQPGHLFIDLRHDLAFGIIGIGIDRTDRADAARRRPGTRTGMVGSRHALAALDQRPHFAASIKDRLQPLELHYFPNFPLAATHGLIACACGRSPTASNSA